MNFTLGQSTFCRSYGSPSLWNSVSIFNSNVISNSGSLFSMFLGIPSITGTSSSSYTNIYFYGQWIQNELIWITIKNSNRTFALKFLSIWKVVMISRGTNMTTMKIHLQNKHSSKKRIIAFSSPDNAKLTKSATMDGLSQWTILIRMSVIFRK